MESFRHSQTQKHSPKNSKKRLTEEQVRILERSFTSMKMLEPERKLYLAKELGIPPRQVAIWYQNKRARWKTQSMGLEYKELQLKLKKALEEKQRLEKDNERLQEELRKAKDQASLLANQTSSNPSVAFEGKFTYDQAGESSLLQCFDLSEESLQLEEFYGYEVTAEFKSQESCL